MMTEHFPIMLQFKPDHPLWGQEEVPYNAPFGVGGTRTRLQPKPLTEERIRAMLDQLARASGLGQMAFQMLNCCFSVGSLEVDFEKENDLIVSLTFRSRHTWQELWAATETELVALGLTLEEVIAANKVASSLMMLARAI